jgi:hypothetical protein
MKLRITAGSGRLPVVDRHDKPIHLGDKLRIQHCVGRYGQTMITEFVATEAHLPYTQLNFPCKPYWHSNNQQLSSGVVGFDYDAVRKVLRGHHVHNDFEHGHETWIEVVP